VISREGLNSFYIWYFKRLLINYVIIFTI
jgi:hypothetical protein